MKFLLLIKKKKKKKKGEKMAFGGVGDIYIGDFQVIHFQYKLAFRGLLCICWRFDLTNQLIFPQKKKN